MCLPLSYNFTKPVVLTSYEYAACMSKLGTDAYNFTIIAPPAAPYQGKCSHRQQEYLHH